MNQEGRDQTCANRSDFYHIMICLAAARISGSIEIYGAGKKPQDLTVGQRNFIGSSRKT